MNDKDKIENNNIIQNKNKYEHLIISGGGIAGINLYKAVKDSNLRGEWEIDNIKSLYGVSIGTIISVLIALRYDWDIIDNYIINRPFHKLFNLDKINLWNIFYNCGVFDINIFINILKPIFLGAKIDIELDITMYDFYKKTGIVLYFYCTELIELKKIEMSPFSTPDLSVINAIYRSCSIPFLFIPQNEYFSSINENNIKSIILTPNKNTKIYVDGFIKTLYPTRECIKNECIDENKILGFTLKKYKGSIENIIDLAKLITFGILNKQMYHIKYEYRVEYENLITFESTYLFFTSQEFRKKIILS